MFNLDDITNENNKEHMTYEIWPHIANHPYRISINGRSGSGKTNSLLNFIKSKIVAILLTRFIFMLKT